jgi:hypothetical protein
MHVYITVLFFKYVRVVSCCQKSFPARLNSRFLDTWQPEVYCIVVVLRADSPGKAAQWFAESIPESWGVLWLVIHLLWVWVDVSSSVIKAWERLYCIPLHTSQHAGALPATTNTSPTSRRRIVSSKYSSYKDLVAFAPPPPTQNLFIHVRGGLMVRGLG